MLIPLLGPEGGTFLPRGSRLSKSGLIVASISSAFDTADSHGMPPSLERALFRPGFTAGMPVESRSIIGLEATEVDVVMRKRRKKPRR